MIGQIIGSLGGLAKSYIDAKTTVKITEAEIKKKELTGKIDWEQSANEVSKDSWKDEFWTIVFLLILATNFVPSLQDTMARGFANLETTPPGSVGHVRVHCRLVLLPLWVPFPAQFWMHQP